MPLSPIVVVAIVNVDVVAVGLFAAVIGVAPLYHWYVNPVPVATTLILMDCPAQTAAGAKGCVVILGNSFTVTTALVVVTDGQVGELITQVYVPACANVSEAMLNDGLVSPVKSVVPKYHWYVIPVPVAVTFNVKALPTHFIVVAAG
jgi:hypothetical protein